MGINMIYPIYIICNTIYCIGRCAPRTCKIWHTSTAVCLTRLLLPTCESFLYVFHAYSYTSHVLTNTHTYTQTRTHTNIHTCDLCNSPTFKPIVMPLRNLNLGDLSTEIVFELWDWNSVSAHDYLGSATTTVQALETAGGKLTVPFKKEKRVKADTKNRGNLVINDFQIIHKPTFFEYIAGGLELDILVAVDFTASNEDPKDPKSLHFMNPRGFNKYQERTHTLTHTLSLLHTYTQTLPTWSISTAMTKSSRPLSNTHTQTHTHMRVHTHSHTPSLSYILTGGYYKCG